MKNIYLITMLFVSLSSFGQRVYLPEHYKKVASESSILIGTFDPSKMGLGLLYISKPVQMNRLVSFVGSIEYGNYNSIQTKILKFCIGQSIVVRNFNINTVICFNSFKTNIEKKIAEPISFEIGLMTKFENIYLLIHADPINYESKIGIGIGF